MDVESLASGTRRQCRSPPTTSMTLAHSPCSSVTAPRSFAGGLPYFKPPRILLADDDVVLRVLVAAALREDGYEVLESQDGGRLLVQIAAAYAGRSRERSATNAAAPTACICTKLSTFNRVKGRQDRLPRPAGDLTARRWSYCLLQTPPGNFNGSRSLRDCIRNRRSRNLRHCLGWRLYSPR